MSLELHRPDSNRQRRAAAGTLRYAALLFLCSCVGADEPEGPAPAAQAQVAPLPGFGLRGRVDQSQIYWSCDEDLRPAARSAAALWNGEEGSHPRFEEYVFAVHGERAPDLEIEWRQGAHDRCMPFGTESSVAHSGPLPLPSFIHLDRDREWSSEKQTLTLAHEFGHILGLAHSPDSRALMFAEPSTAKPMVSEMDRRGLETLYGSERAPGPNDLILRSSDQDDGKPALVLRGVAPGSMTEFGFVDVTGDSRAELAVWRTDAEGYGAMTLYLFAPPGSDDGSKLRVERSLGPIYGLYAPGAELSVSEEVTEPPSETLLFILEWPDGRYGARPMMQPGRPSVRMPGPLRLSDGREDTDGDGVFDDTVQALRSLALEVETDLDGDGANEVVSRP